MTRGKQRASLVHRLPPGVPQRRAAYGRAEGRPSQEGTRAHGPARLSCACSLIGLSGPAPGEAAGPSQGRLQLLTHLSLEGPRDARHAEDVTRSAQGWRPQPSHGGPPPHIPQVDAAAAGRRKAATLPHLRAFRLVPDNCQQPGGEGGGRAADEKQQPARRPATLPRTGGLPRWGQIKGPRAPRGRLPHLQKHLCAFNCNPGKGPRVSQPECSPQ